MKLLSVCLVQLALALCMLFVYHYANQFQPQPRLYKHIDDPQLTNRIDGRDLVLTDRSAPNRRVIAKSLVSDDFVTARMQSIRVYTSEVMLQAESAHRQRDSLLLIGAVTASATDWRITTADLLLDKHNKITSNAATHYSAPKAEINARGFDYDTITGLLQLRAPRAVITGIGELDIGNL